MATRIATAALLLATLVLTGCGTPTGTAETPAVRESATASPRTAPEATSTPTATPVPVPAVPRRDASPEAQVVAPQLPPPARLQAGDVRLDMPVLPMGVDEAGAMELPEDTAEAGWYRFGAAPGGTGTTVIAAHVDSLVHGLGAFARLREIPVGASVTVITADGTAHLYRVDRVERTPKTEVPLDLLFDRGGPERLVLVTCGGEFNRNTGHYLDNVIVTALPGP